MPSAERIILPSQDFLADFAAWLRRNPVTGTAAISGCVLFGALLFGLLGSLQTPPRVETVTAKAVETAGRAPLLDETARAKCREQTWPYLSRSCIVRPDGRTRNVRVISTDSAEAPAAAAIAAERIPTSRRPASPVVTTREARAVAARDDSMRRRGAEQYTAGRLVTMHEYDVPAYDHSERRNRVTAQYGDRHGNLFGF